MTSARPFVTSTIFLASAAIAGQAISFAAMLVVARLYRPADVGLLGLFGIVFTFASVAASWRYELAIVTVSGDKEAADISLFVVSAGIVGSVVAVAVLAALNLLAVGLIVSKELITALWWLPISLLFVGVNLSGGSWCTRQGYVGLLAALQIVPPLVTAAIQIIFASFGGSGEALVAGFVLGQLSSAVVVGAPLCVALVNNFDRHGLVQRMYRVAHNHRAHVFYTVPYTILVHFYFQAPMIVLGALYGPSNVGFFSLVLRATSTPIGILPYAAAQMFFPAMSRDRHQLEAWEPKLRSLLFGFGLLIAPAAGALLAIGPDIFAFVFGEPWRTAGIFAQIMIASTFLNGVVGGYDRIFFLLSREKAAFQIKLSATILSVLFMGASELLFSKPIAVIAAWSAIHFALAIIWACVAFRIAGFPLSGLIRAWLNIIGITATIAVVALLGKTWFGYNEGFVVFVSSMCILYVVAFSLGIPKVLAVLRRPT